MKIRIDTDQINIAATDVRNELDELYKEINTLRQDVDEVKNYYTGEDVKLIIKKYNERIDNLNPLLEIYEDYRKYFNLVAGKYEENSNETSVGLKKVDDILYNEENNNLIEGGLSE